MPFRELRNMREKKKKNDFRENNPKLCFKLPGFVWLVDTKMDLLKG